MSSGDAGWTPVSGDNDLAATSARAVLLPGHDVVIWRAEAGSVHAWENRCPHRGMRMSFGQVRGDTLVCRYHGWGFNQSGQCQNIPAAPDMPAPPAACIKTYACKEAAGLIWVDTSEAPGDTPDFADCDVLAEPAFCKSIYVDGEGSRIMESLKVVRFLPFGLEPSALEDMTWSVRELSPTLLEISAAQGGLTEALVLALHQGADNRCGIHVIASSADDEATDSARRLHYGKWARRLRHVLSGVDTSGDGMAALV